MKHIKNFKYAEDYNKLHEEGGMIDVCPAVSYIDELQTVRYEVRGGAGTIVMANEDGDKRFLTIEEYRGSVIKDKCDEEGYEAIGVIVVPASHTQNGKARMIALEIHEGLMWSNHFDDIPTLINYDYFSAIAVTDEIRNMDEWRKCEQGEIDREHVSSYDNLIFASDVYFVDNPVEYELYGNPYDTQTYWIFHNEEPGDTPILPSPYLNDGSKNPIYHNEYVEYDGEKVYNALANLDGKGDTKKIVDFYPDESDTAPNVCYTYSTLGTSEGDWYLPSVGELGYLFARSRRINAALQEVGASFSITPSFYDNLLSSSEVNSDYAWVAFFRYGKFDSGDNKSYDEVVVPFCEVEV